MVSYFSEEIITSDFEKQLEMHLRHEHYFIIIFKLGNFRNAHLFHACFVKDHQEDEKTFSATNMKGFISEG